MAPQEEHALYLTIIHDCLCWSIDVLMCHWRAYHKSLAQLDISLQYDTLNTCKMPFLPAQAVMEFLHERLVGEGNVLRHLELLGYKLHYKQDPLVEYPFAISNLAVDLRDGLRLLRLAELLTGERL